MYVFIFKQKTAYEMRISDWSSDVCSSDLTAHIPMPPDQPPARVMALARGADGQIWVATGHGLLRLDPRQGALERVALGRYSEAGIRTLMLARRRAEIGSAAVRARVCLCMYIPVCASIFNKTYFFYL